MLDSLFLPFQIPKESNQLKHGDLMLFYGSCFSDELAERAAYRGFKIEANPLGTIFHPLAIARFFEESLNEYFNLRAVFRDESVFSLDAGTGISAVDESSLSVRLKQIYQNWQSSLKESKYLFVTFGTAWGYRYLLTNELAANCHKLPGNLFKKELCSAEDITSYWFMILKKIYALNPELNVYFTVSPVRHVRDGLVENNWSKAILIEAVRMLTQQTDAKYFPAYELITDVLRDYRFFKRDRVHPTDEAVDFIWEQLEKAFCSDETIKLSREVVKIRMAEQHKSSNPEGNQFKVHQQRTADRKALLSSVNPEIVW